MVLCTYIHQPMIDDNPRAGLSEVMTTGSAVLACLILPEGPTIRFLNLDHLIVYTYTYQKVATGLVMIEIVKAPRGKRGCGHREAPSSNQNFCFDLTLVMEILHIKPCFACCAHIDVAGMRISTNFKLSI